MKRDDQPRLFAADCYGGGEPAARKTDPETSHQAAERVKRSGIAQAHAVIALAIAERLPGSTFHELWAEATEAERAALGDTTELMRRLGSLRNAGKVNHGPARACRVKGTQMVTWVLVGSENS